MAILFYLLFFITPLLMWPYTSEIFEFNKMLFVYAITAAVLGLWIINCIRARKIIFSRTILDIPIVVFLFSQLISTLLSLDPRTSFLGYYSRFNGGLLSNICYSILYWAFVSNINKKQTRTSLYLFIYSMGLSSIYGVLEHFGIDKQIWVQDVQNRVFSTLGQPNWLAAVLLTLIPLTIVFGMKNKSYFVFSVLFFVTLLFTKSKSGIVAFVLESIIFWGFFFYNSRFKYLKLFVWLNAIFLGLYLIIMNPFNANKNIITPQGPALEVGGTNSGTIRKIVWKGAFEIWKAYPLFGSGNETFAYVYPMFRPAEHNLVSEWDFIYNKAHNEYLNYLATTGLVGLISYLVFVSFSIYQISKGINDKKNEDISKLKVALLSGYISILATNFFGFSVVNVQLCLFLFPAIALTIKKDGEETKYKNVTTEQGLVITLIIGLIIYAFINVYRYFRADINYNYGKANNQAKKPIDAVSYLSKSIKSFPKEPLYHYEIAKSYTYLNNKDEAIAEAKKAIELSPNNVNLKRVLYTVYVQFSRDDPSYLLSAQQTLEDSIKQAPTDAKLYYNLAVTLWRTGRLDEAEKVFQKTLELKDNYKEGYFAYGLELLDNKKPGDARKQFEYILQNIDPNDELTKNELIKLSKP